MATNKDKIIIEQDLNISDSNFKFIEDKLKNGTFFEYLQTSNPTIILEYSKDEDTTSFHIKNIVDLSDEEILEKLLALNIGR